MAATKAESAVDKITLPANLDPLQWGTAKRARLVVSVCVPVLALTYGSSSYVSILLRRRNFYSLPILQVSSIPYLIQKYDSSREVVILGVSLYVLGFGLGPVSFSKFLLRNKIDVFEQLIFGPTSDLIGRRKVYVATYGMLCSLQAALNL